MLNAKNAKMRALKNQSRWFSKALKSIRMDGNPMTMYIGEILPEVRNWLEEKGWKIITKEAEVRGLDLNLITCSSIKLSEEEIKESMEILTKLDSEVIDIITFNLPIENSNRSLVVIEKKKETNKIYPRNYDKIVKNKKVK